jgi:C4-dicarboxylate transporter, DctM subunit
MGDLTLSRLMQTFVNSARTFAVIAFVFLGAVILAQSISVLQLPQKLLEGISSVGLSPLLMLGWWCSFTCCWAWSLTDCP